MSTDAGCFRRARLCRPHVSTGLTDQLAFQAGAGERGPHVGPGGEAAAAGPARPPPRASVLPVASSVVAPAASRGLCLNPEGKVRALELLSRVLISGFWKTSPPFL